NQWRGAGGNRRGPMADEIGESETDVGGAVVDLTRTGGRDRDGGGGGGHAGSPGVWCERTLVALFNRSACPVRERPSRPPCGTRQGPARRRPGRAGIPRRSAERSRRPRRAGEPV